MLNMILKMKFNFNMDIGYGLRPLGSTLKVTLDCDRHHTERIPTSAGVPAGHHTAW
jgi:hypothetical protein